MSTFSNTCYSMIPFDLIKTTQTFKTTCLLIEWLAFSLLLTMHNISCLRAVFNENIIFYLISPIQKKEIEIDPIFALWFHVYPWKRNKILTVLHFSLLHSISVFFVDYDFSMQIIHIYYDNWNKERQTWIFYF